MCFEAKSGQVDHSDPFTEVNWASGVDLKSGRRTSCRGGGARYEQEPWNLAPGVQGGHSWHPTPLARNRPV